jgi:hypothetical protein
VSTTRVSKKTGFSTRVVQLTYNVSTFVFTSLKRPKNGQYARVTHAPANPMANATKRGMIFFMSQ